MWRILKAEFKYYGKFFILPGMIVLMTLLVNLFQNWNHGTKDLSSVMGVLSSMMLFVVFIKILIDAKEKRLRQIAILPLKMWQIGFSRWLLFLTIWMAFLLLFWLTSYRGKSFSESDLFEKSLFLNGLLMDWIALLFIGNDYLKSISGTKRRYIFPKIILSGLLLLIYAVIYLFVFSVPDFKSWIKVVPLKISVIELGASAQNSCIFTIIAICLVGVTVFSFIKRKSYL